MEYISKYLKQVENIAKKIDQNKIESVILEILKVKKQNGRIFFLGVGGSAANCSHAVNDFRKIANIESYTPADNVAEITARTNDEGWDTVFKPWLECSKINKKDLIFILSVGGGNKEKKISVNLVTSIEYAKKIGCNIVGIVGRDGGYTFINTDKCIVIPTQSSDTITPHAEAWQSVIWHLIVTDPRIQSYSNKWESLS
tara:strand:- start:1656 stop:2252 length:597 start_codon:yes stop_codon:yes gene_type:complete